MFPISYFVFSVNYLVCLLMTNHIGGYNTMHVCLWFTITTTCPPALLSMVIDPKGLPCIMH